MKYTVFIPGHPAPQGSKVGFVNPRTIKFLGPFKVNPKSLIVVMKESSKGVEPWRRAVKAACAGLVPEPIESPVYIQRLYLLPKPKTVTREWPTSKNEGDIDKLDRSTFDGLVMAGVLKDDSLVVDGRHKKRYARPGETLGAWIEIRTIPSESERQFIK